MYPPFPYTVRRCTEDYKISDSPIIIEKGTLIFFSVPGIQRDPKYYNEPTVFKPERQSNAEKAGKGFIEMPNLAFGLGKRSCLAIRYGKLQSKIAIILLLRKFRFELADKHKNTELKWNPLAPTAFPINGINLKVISR